MASLRHRIILTLLPLLVLMAAVGCYGVVLLYRVGGRIDQILRENYASVIYMERLKETLERMDSSFQFALAGREADARKQFDDNWRLYSKHLADERANITVPGEAELVSRLSDLGERYRRQGEKFFAQSDAERRREEYFGAGRPDGLLVDFKEMKDAANKIMRLNQDNMEQANEEARQTAKSSLVWFAVSLLAVAVLGLLLARAHNRHDSAADRERHEIG